MCGEEGGKGECRNIDRKFDSPTTNTQKTKWLFFARKLQKILLDKRLTKFLYTFKNNDYKKIAINSTNKEKKKERTELATLFLN